MPTYTYRCDECSEIFDLAHSATRGPAPEVAVCPICDSDKISKIIHATNVIYKGHGFYSTDNNQNRRKK